MDSLHEAIKQLLDENVHKIIISAPKPGANYRKITLDLVGGEWQSEMLTEKQAFHNRITTDAVTHIADLVTHYKQLSAFSSEKEFTLLISKKGKLNLTKRNTTSAPSAKTAHNREKNVVFSAKDSIPPLVDMGIFSKEGKLIAAMSDKLRQINRFCELVGHELSHVKSGERFNVIDFGCGKSYLTFILYHYLKNTLGLDVHIVGIDLKADVIEKCNAAARKYSYDNLNFEVADIAGYSPKFDVDMVVSLHACDTATDHVIYNGVKWNAKYIFSVPCCQHELFSQMKTETLTALTDYGLIKERLAALFTDTIRGKLLESSGYRVDMCEFIDFAHTPKNILIRAKRVGLSADKRKKSKEQAVVLIREFALSPSLYSLLYGEKGGERSD